jgi:methylmalonyl-CoA mutase C-terminal domain/subunit
VWRRDRRRARDTSSTDRLRATLPRAERPAVDDGVDDGGGGLSSIEDRIRVSKSCRRGDIYALTPMERTYRVVVAKPGLDGHDRGAKVIARALRDAGFEVVYTGIHQTPEQVVQAVVQEDADAVGLSLLSGAHLVLVPKVIEQLAAAGRGDVLVIVGGIIPDEDIEVLERAGVARVFTPGAPLGEIGEWLEATLDARERVN